VSVRGDRFYALRLFARGLRLPVERVTGNRLVAHPLTNRERAALWSAKYERVPQELRDKPIKRHPRAVFVERTKPEPACVIPIRRRA
jgi:hypothetical protein